VYDKEGRLNVQQGRTIQCMTRKVYKVYSKGGNLVYGKGGQI